MVFIRQLAKGQQFMGDPDGPMRFVPSLGMEVPTYIDPRKDLKSEANCASAHKSVDYHVPITMRGKYFPSDLADYDPEKNYPIGNQSKRARCNGLKADGQVCQKLAMHRSGFCSNHGGALHPADKMFSSMRGIAPSDLSKLNRHRKVLLGIIKVSELDDEEIAKGAIRNEDGTFSKSQLLEKKIYEEMKREFFARAERMMQEQAYDMIKVMREMALSEINEPKDRIQAAQWNIERILGKTPDVLITHTSDKPFESIMSAITGGSRDDYRNGEAPAIVNEILDGEVLEDDEDEEDDEDDEDEPIDVEVEIESKSPVSAMSTALAVQEKKDAIQATKDRINKARNRRYAARAQGADSLENLGFGINFVQEKKLAGTGTLRMKLIAPDDLKAPKSR